MKHNRIRKYSVFTISILCITSICLGVYAWNAHKKAEQYKLYMVNNCQHAFDELATAVGEMDTALQKSLCATSPAMTSAICTELFGKAMTARMSLGVLPFSTYELEQTAGFISRVGDYAFALSRAAASGEALSAEHRENLKSLADASKQLSAGINSLQTDMLDGVLTMDELYKSEQMLDKAENDELPSTVGNSLKLIEEEFPETPSLIYDGPFSVHLRDKSPVMLENLEEIDENQGREIASSFLRVGHTRVYPVGVLEGEVPCIIYETRRNSGDVVTVAVTKQGGKVLSMLSSHSGVGGNSLEVSEALRRAADFLSTRGYKDMEETYYMVRDGVLTVNYAAAKNGVRFYPDLIKVSVAMDNGEVCGFEAMGYIMSHGDRALPEAAVSMEEALKQLPEDLAVETSRLAVIPSPGGKEKLCHEFVCQNDAQQRFIVYVNAVSGEQEKILLLLEDENGSLTL
ncbi:MAG: germination protein YpeB [Oscillospiraceae bacterium]|nr:germination protein YpeB [Oscillospiraceae bacterium]